MKMNKKVKTIGIVSLSAGTLGEDFVNANFAKKLH